MTVVNFCIKKLAVLPNFELPNCTDSGYSTWDDLALVLDDSSKKHEAFPLLTLKIIFLNNYSTHHQERPEITTFRMHEFLLGKLRYYLVIKF